MHPRYKITIERYQEVMVAVSESVIKSPVMPPSGEITMTSYPVDNETPLSRKPCIPDKKLLWITIRKSWSPSDFYKKIIIQKTYQFMNVVNGVSHSHKTANIFFSFDSVA